MIDFNKEGETLNAVLFPQTIYPGDIDEAGESFRGYVEQLFIRCEMNELDRAYRLTKLKIESICPQPFLPKFFTAEEQQLKTKRFNLEGAIDKLFKLEKERRQEQTSKEEPGQAIEKIKWLGSPEQFGFIFGELAAKGYIELPTKAGIGVFSKLADLCLQYFEITVTKGKSAGKQTTKENLQRALNPESNQLSDKGKNNLKLPPLKELM